MSGIANIDLALLSKLQNQISQQLNGSTSLEESAQKFTDIIYDEFKESIVLVRFFATVPFGKLPSSNKMFVSKLVSSNGLTDLLNEQTPVLSLLGTRGEMSEWNDRRNSKGHVGIPLISADFIESIPMMSRLLKDLGVPLDWLDGRDSEIVSKTIGSMAGVFFVPEAKTTTDNRGRKIIAAQDFVQKYKVKTVFGVGGGYLGKDSFITSIVFCRDEIGKTQAEQFMRFVNVVKSSTMGVVGKGRMFVN